jgi:hypothetical protein
VLLDTRGFSVLVDYGAHKETIYILGTKRGLEWYRGKKEAGRGSMESTASGDGKNGGYDNSNKKDARVGKESLETTVNKCGNTLGRFPTPEKPIEDPARLAAANRNKSIFAVHPANNWKLGESQVRSMRDDLEERKRKEEEPSEEKIGEGGDATRKTGEDDTKVKIVVNRVDGIYIL